MFTRIIASITRALKEHELSVAQLAALYVIDERTTLRINDLASELDLGAPSASRLVDDLVRQKLVARTEDPDDRRARRLTLTAKGSAFIAKSSEARMSTMASVISDIPASALKALWSLGRTSE